MTNFEFYAFSKISEPYILILYLYYNWKSCVKVHSLEHTKLSVVHYLPTRRPWYRIAPSLKIAIKIQALLRFANYHLCLYIKKVYPVISPVPDNHLNLSWLSEETLFCSTRIRKIFVQKIFYEQSSITQTYQELNILTFKGGNNSTIKSQCSHHTQRNN